MTEQALADFDRTDGWKVGVDGSVALITVGVGGSIDTGRIPQSDRRRHPRKQGTDVQLDLGLEGGKISRISQW
jgi:hypothetical protein